MTWTSDDEDIATVSNAAGSQGVATGHSEEAANVAASFDGVQGSAMLTVTAAVLESIVVTPQDASFAVGTKLEYTATGIFSDDSEQDLTDQVIWSSAAAVVTVSNGALNADQATAETAGSTYVNATLDGVTGTTPVTVPDATLEVSDRWRCALL